MKPPPALLVILARARHSPPGRGSRRAASVIPANMAAAALTAEKRAWAHSPLAGALYELGLRPTRAIAIATDHPKLARLEKPP